MAARDRPDQERLERARRIGQRLVERLDLSPPVRIDLVVNRYADIEEDSIPADCDAVVVGLTSTASSRPLVILERSRPYRRQRFSLAHELGHILIPGHLGIEACKAEVSYYSSSIQEREAHAFASEVLIPTRWLDRLITESGSPQEVFQAAEVAQISAAASCLAITRLLPKGCVVALMSGPVVELSLASPNTEAKRPDQGRALDQRSIERFAVEAGEGHLGGRTIRWWRFEEKTCLPSIRDPRGASEILREIVYEVYADDDKARQYAFASINGIAGAAKNMDPQVTTPEQMLARLRARFADRGRHAPVLDDPRFEAYLVRKAEELASV